MPLLRVIYENVLKNRPHHLIFSALMFVLYFPLGLVLWLIATANPGPTSPDSTFINLGDYQQ